MEFWREFWRESVADWKADVQPEIDNCIAQFRLYLQHQRRQRLRRTMISALGKWPIVTQRDGLFVQDMANILAAETKATLSDLRRDVRRGR